MSFLQIVLLVLAVLLFLRAFNLIAGVIWYNKPRPPGTTVLVNGKRYYYTLKGSGDSTVVIEAGLGSVSPEWWMIQDELSQNARVLTYDRAGYGWSEFNPEPRTSGDIAGELFTLLTTLEINGPLILVGHSQGGYYTHHFARVHPKRIAGVVFVDPLPPRDDRLRTELSPELYKASGLDKTGRVKARSWLCAFGLLKVLAFVFKRTAPFTDYKRLPANTVQALWRHLLLPKTFKTMLREYREGRKAINSEKLKRSGDFPQVPVEIVSQSRARAIDGIARSSKLSRDDATRIEDLRRELVREYLTFSPESEWIEVDSGRFLHLDAPQAVIEAVKQVLERATKK